MSKNNQGFTLVEIVVATGIVMMTLVGISAGVTFAIKNSRYSKEKSLSVRYAQESIEMLRNQRDTLGWDGFIQALEIQNGQVQNYCLSSIPTTTEDFIRLNQGLIEQCHNQKIPDTPFVRSLNIQRNNDQLNVTSNVTWSNGDENYNSELVTSLHKWN